MKLSCSDHGIHFPADFDVTLGEDCAFWYDRGLENLPDIQKKKLWDWMFAMPTDEIWLQSRYVLGLWVNGRKMSLAEKAKLAWHKWIKGYDRMTEAERQAAQKDYFNKKVRI